MGRSRGRVVSRVKWPMMAKLSCCWLDLGSDLSRPFWGICLRTRSVDPAHWERVKGPHLQRDGSHASGVRVAKAKPRAGPGGGMDYLYKSNSRKKIKVKTACRVVGLMAACAFASWGSCGRAFGVVPGVLDVWRMWCKAW